MNKFYTEFSKKYEGKFAKGEEILVLMNSGYIFNATVVCNEIKLGKFWLSGQIQHENVNGFIVSYAKRFWFQKHIVKRDDVQ